MRIDAFARPDVGDVAGGTRGEEAEAARGVAGGHVSPGAPVGAGRSHPIAPGPGGTGARRERGQLPQELHAAADGVASVLRAVRTAQHLDRLQPGRLDEIEERVDAAARRRVRVANAVHEDVHLVARQAPHIDAAHRRARPQEIDARLFEHGLRDDRLRTLEDVHRLNDVHFLADGASVLHRAGRGRHGDFGLDGGGIEPNIERRRGWARGDRHAAVREPFERCHEHVAAGGDIGENKATIGAGDGRAGGRVFAGQELHLGAREHRAGGIADDAGDRVAAVSVREEWREEDQEGDEQGSARAGMLR